MVFAIEGDDSDVVHRIMVFAIEGGDDDVVVH